MGFRIPQYSWPNVVAPRNVVVIVRFEANIITKPCLLRNLLNVCYNKLSQNFQPNAAVSLFSFQ